MNFVKNQLQTAFSMNNYPPKNMSRDHTPTYFFISPNSKIYKKRMAKRNSINFSIYIEPTSRYSTATVFYNF